MLIANVSMSQIEANSQFINERRKAISFLPNDPAVASFLEVCVSLISFFSLEFSLNIFCMLLCSYC